MENKGQGIVEHKSRWKEHAGDVVVFEGHCRSLFVVGVVVCVGFWILSRDCCCPSVDAAQSFCTVWTWVVERW